MVEHLKINRVRRTYKGGRKIDAFEGITNAGQLPEDWTASVTSADNGDDIFPDEGLGFLKDGTPVKNLVGENFHMLVKLLDSEERLVVQAHPTVEFAERELGVPHGKTECWYFLDCDSDAYVYIGFKEGVTRENLEKAFYEQNIDYMLSLLHRIPVKNGDFIFVDGGLPHAIGPGCFMIELQEPTDLMVVAERFTPSGRKIADYRIDMGLGLQKMFDVYDYTGYSEADLRKHFMPKSKYTANGVTTILDKDMTDKFSMFRLDGNAFFEVSNKPAVAVVISGSGKINNVNVVKGDRLLITDESDITLSESENLSVIVCI